MPYWALFFAGSPAGNPLTPVGTCRYDSSLGDQIIGFIWVETCWCIINDNCQCQFK